MSETTPTQNVKQGAMIGGVVCFGLGLAIMAFSTWLVPVYGALLFAAFVLSIVAMSQKRVAGGVMLLLGCVILAPGFWLYLTLTRSARALDKAANYIEQENLKQGIGIQTRGTPVAAKTPMPSRQMAAVAPNQLVQASPRPLAETTRIENIAKVHAEDISTVDAHRVQISLRTVVDTGASAAFRPSFSEDGKFVIYSKQEGRGTVIAIVELNTLQPIQTLRTAQEPRDVALSPDNKRLVYVTPDSHVWIKEITTGKEIGLPIVAAGSFGHLRWPAEQHIFFDNMALDLNDLKYSQLDAKARAGREEVRYKVTYESPGPGNENWGFHLMNNDGSYGHLLFNYNLRDSDRSWKASGNQKHFVFLNEEAGSAQLTVCYLGFRQPLQQRVTVKPSEIQGLPASVAAFLRLPQGQSTGAWPVYGAQINPLNQKIIGHDSNDYCGAASLRHGSGDEWPVTVTYERRPFRDGDVLQLESTWWIWAPIHVDNKVAAATSDDHSSGATPNRQTGSENATASDARQDATSTALSNSAGTRQFPGEKFSETRMRLLTPVDIRTWSDVKLQYAINEMFARHGAEFGNRATAKWFSQFSWYQPQSGTDFDQIEKSMMTDVERQNLQLLGAYRTAKREALKQGSSAQHDQRGRNRRVTAKQDEEEPNPLAEQLLQSILRGLQRGLQNRR